MAGNRFRYETVPYWYTRHSGVLIVTTRRWRRTFPVPRTSFK